MIPPWSATVNRLPAHQGFPFPAVYIPACGGTIPPCGAVCVPFWNAIYSDYRITVTNVYNNFPWPNPTPEQKEKIEKTAKGILDARALYPVSSLADLYDPLTMPPELRKAHQLNDKAVMQAYGMPIKETDEAACVAWLMKLYQEKVNNME